MPELDGVEMLSPAQEPSFPTEWYALSRPDHFWFEWRLAAALRQIRDVGLSLHGPLRALEIGAGTGVLRDQIEGHTAWTVDIVDLQIEALRRARPGRGRRFYCDVMEQPGKLPRDYDVAVLFDVIEHVEDAPSFLRAVLDHVKPGGHLLVNVPALPILFGEYDRQAGHRRRYTARTLVASFADLDLEVRDVRYWGLSLVPLLLARKYMQAVAGNGNVIRTGFQPPGQLAHGALKALMRLETALVRRAIFGSSVLLAGRRRTSG